MSSNPNEKLMDAIKELIATHGSWSEKKDALVNYAVEYEVADDLSEFLGWWDVELFGPDPEAA